MVSISERKVQNLIDTLYLAFAMEVITDKQIEDLRDMLKNCG